MDELPKNSRTLEEVQCGLDATLRNFGKAMNANATSDTPLRDFAMAIKSNARSDTAMRDIGNEMNGAASNPAIAERIERIGKVSALAVVQASETTAKDIKAVAQTAVDLAAAIMNEADQLAADVQARAEKMSEYLHEFSSVAQKVSTAMRDTRAEVLRSRGHAIAPTGVLPFHDAVPPVADASSNH